uniref:Uncharacterized protein n=1 Tax=Timema cristinae TaxID=61476 RepID=A0A7R9CYD9_TIMCR|nr:unnamed protein product [Timema cristinae]
MHRINPSTTSSARSCANLTNPNFPPPVHINKRGGTDVIASELRRGGFHSICSDGSMLQVSCSTQKLLPLPQLGPNFNALFSEAACSVPVRHLVTISLDVEFGLFVFPRIRKSTMPKYDPPYVKKTSVKKYVGKGPEEAAMESVNKILTFGNMPSYSRGDSQRVLFRPVNHMSSGLVSRFHGCFVVLCMTVIGSSSWRLPQCDIEGNSLGPPPIRLKHSQVLVTTEHKLQQMKRMGVGSGSEEDAGHSGEEETVSFIDIPPNNLSKLPEKGILKKSGPYGTVMGDVCPGKEKWSEDSQSDNQEILSQSDNNLGPDMMGGGVGAISEVERTLKSLNGYHEDILEALRNAASHRGATTPSGSSSAFSEEILRKSLESSGMYGGALGDYKRSSSQEKVCDGPQQTHTVMVEGGSSIPHHHHHHHHPPLHSHQVDEDEEDEVPPSCGPIRIRNLEDLIRQLEHHSARHMSPSGSEDIRIGKSLQRKEEHSSHFTLLLLDKEVLAASSRKSIVLEAAINSLSSGSNVQRNSCRKTKVPCVLCPVEHGLTQFISLQETQILPVKFKLAHCDTREEAKRTIPMKSLLDQENTAWLIRSQQCLFNEAEAFIRTSVCVTTMEPESRLRRHMRRCRAREEEPRFVYGRYRHPTGRHPPGYHPQHHPQEEEGIYETADHDRGGTHMCGDTPDSESDEFIQAQQQLVRSASEEALPVVSTGAAHHSRHHSSKSGGPPPPDAATGVKREYYPSPPPSESEEDDESSGKSASPGQQRCEEDEEYSGDDDNDSSRDTQAASVSGTEQTALLRPKRYPEYKH